MHRLFATTCALLLTISVAHAQEKHQDKHSQKFLTEAIQGNYAEVEMGKLAQDNGKSDKVKSFGQMLVTDHSAGNDKAIAAAKELGVTPPAGPSKKQKSAYAKIAKLKGTAFDKSFTRDMVADHKKDIAAYKKEAKQQDAAGQYAKDSLPTLQKHLDTAESLVKGR